MTCIVAVSNGKKVWIGGDCAGIDEDDLSIVRRSDAKVFRNGPYVIGYTSSFRMGQVLRFGTELPVSKADPGTEDHYRFMCTTWLDAVRQCMDSAGYLGKDREDREELGSFVVGVGGRIYTVEPDLNIGIPMSPYAAVGCGAAFASGALHALTGGRKRVWESTVRAALLAAEDGSAGVLGPFVIMST